MRGVHGSRWSPFGVGSPSIRKSPAEERREGEREEGGTTLYDERGRRHVYIVYTKMSADGDDYDLRINVMKESLVYRLGSHPPRMVAIAANSFKGRPHSLLSPPLPSSFYLLAPPSLILSRF